MFIKKREAFRPIPCLHPPALVSGCSGRLSYKERRGMCSAAYIRYASKQTQPRRRRCVFLGRLKRERDTPWLTCPNEMGMEVLMAAARIASPAVIPFVFAPSP